MNYPEKLRVGDMVYSVIYQPVLRATSSVRIKNGAVVLKLSRFAHGSKRDEIVSKFLKWAQKRLVKVSGNDFVNPVYEDGGRIVTHNKIYELNVDVSEGRHEAVSDLPAGRQECPSQQAVLRQQNTLARLKNGNLIQIELARGPGVSSKKIIKSLAEKLIIKDQTSYLREVLDELNQLYFQENFAGCRFKRSVSRFGSCSSKRNINISFRLLFAPREIFRYVCVHELAHLKEFNHSGKFWCLVESAMPNYKDCEKWLKNNGFLLG